MTQILIVRHGKAAAGWGDDLDPGLDEVGHEQARIVVPALAARVGALNEVQLYSSPLRRAKETAVPALEAWDKLVTIDDAVAEIPSPDLSVDERGPWLREIMADRWGNLSAQLQNWREELIARICGQEKPAIFFSHFIAINVITGFINNDDRVVNFYPDNCSITRLERRADGGLVLLEQGAQADTHIN